MDVYIYLEGANSFVEDRMGDHLLLLQSNQICPQFNSDEIDVDNGLKKDEDDNGNKEGNDRSEDDVGRFGYQNKVVHVSLDNKEA